MSGDKHKQNFDNLRQICCERSIEEFGNDIVWFRNDKNNSSQVFISRIADYTNKEDWDEQFGWFKKNLERFSNFFKPEIAKM